MEFDAHLDAIERESAALRGAAARGPLDAVVPTCPDWTLEELVGHVCYTQRWAMLNVQRATPEAHVPFEEVGDAHTGPAVIDAFAATTSELLSTLRDAGPEAPAWAFVGAPVSGFWARRAALEVAMHRWDGENAIGIAEPIDAPLAVDGIDELFDFGPVLTAAKFAGTSGTMHVHSTDTDGEWLVDFDNGLAVTREHGKGDVALRGPASDLMLVLYGRVPPETVELHGDGALVERWQQLATF